VVDLRKLRRGEEELERPLDLQDDLFVEGLQDVGP
jgi:hypothetical protein